MRRLLLSSLILAGVGACSSADNTPRDAGLGADATVRADATGGPDASTADGAAPDTGPRLWGPLLDQDCDPIAPTRCGLPFPSNAYTRDDPSAPTGRRVAFGATTLPTTTVGADRRHLDPRTWNESDGFSPGLAPFTHFPGATTAGLPSKDDIARSLMPDSPTVLIEAESLARVPHFAELDMTAPNPSQRVLMVRPVIRLKNATRYIVAMRRIADAHGDPIPPGPVFAALKSGSPSAEPSVDLRRALYADIFERLGRAQISKDDLQIAWDFTTASDQNVTRWMLAMRDDAFAKVGADGPEYTIVQVDENPGPHVRRRIRGNMRVPLYLDQPDPGARLVFGPDGLPRQNGTAEFPFTAIIPNSVADGAPGALLQNGHGLLGSHTEGLGSHLAELADSKHYVVFAVDWIGMAEPDAQFILTRVLGNFANFRAVTDRLHQGILNALLAMRMMSGRFARDPNVMFNGRSAIDSSTRYYRGDSQGGILGVPYMALTQDVSRGLLGVPGMAYSLLLNRSVDFDPFFEYIRQYYPDGRDTQIVIALTQMQWDRAEGTGYAQHIITEPFPNTAPKQVLLHVALGDHQVTSLGGELLARSIGVKHIRPVNRTVFGLEEVDSPYQGSGLVEFDFGLVEPMFNVPPRDGEDPHGKVRRLPSAMSQTDTFLRTGVIDMSPCEGRCRGN